ncbi:hypothetical protein FF38_02906 [Lucilia cuprina]|uniref:Zinc finger PHD-type domain-containing protein n=1 Tax=Lucilia cuprina TaxID=7375 RepID=A0A0L0CHP9_LUCCU|nr:hypothetical protein FF38_02906 [Lucilia cuprina]
MQPKTIPLQCPVCANNLTKQQYKVGCGICGLYYHPECAGVSNKMFEDLKKTHAAFICKSCSNKTAPTNVNVDILRRMEEIKNSIENKMDMEEIKNSIENKIDKNKSELEERMNNGFINLEANGLIDNLRKEVNGELSKMKSDVKHCYSFVKEIDKTTNRKMEALMAKNNVLERRFNRSDILISGLPNKMDQIHNYVIKIAQLVGVHITDVDINHCCFIKNQKCILVKFNSVYIRDNIMKKYYKSDPILLKNVVCETVVAGGGADKNAVVSGEVTGGNAVVSGVETGGSVVVEGEVTDENAVDNDVANVVVRDVRVYLRYNLSLASRRLQYICRKLLLQKKIKKFHLINMDVPKAKIFKLDGNVTYLNIGQCAELLDDAIQGDDPSGNQ